MPDLILVTGASGFVGKWCVVKLLEKGYRVRGTIRSQAKAERVRRTLEALVGPDVLARLELVEADILADRGWAEAMAGVDAVMHVATVIRGDEPRDQSLVIRPAIEGTERILKATHAAGIKRLIVTSSIATVGYGHGHTTGTRTYNETHFTNLANMRHTWAYCIGKTKAEQLAWAFAEEHGLDLTTIHPGAIIGPALDEDASISVGLVGGLLDGTTPALPSNGFSIVDVRDVADMHVAALENPAANGQRYLATAEYMPFPEVGRVLQELYPDRKIPNRPAPDWAIRLVALFGGPARQIINDIGNVKIFDGSKGEALMGHPYISARQSIKDTAEAVIRFGLKLKMA
ncbi:MAG TPA: NAD-dependent epimerase/dehydratase family protein [Devosia sp.]|jgi:nucleoside-diphosphate-sugar epimerase|nr:NAD-dependent epimerase/dehydratase family protein [Devosia sp.]